MSDAMEQAYDEDLTAVLEMVWGEGFMSPGGTDEVDRYLQGIDLAGHTVLDIGCGLGGVEIQLVQQHRATSVVGIDVEQSLIDRCNHLAEKHGLANRLTFLCVEPGPLPFSDNCFSCVTSKDSIIHIPDKAALAQDVFRVLAPDGWFVASDWLAGYEDEPSTQMQAYLSAEGLGFGLASADQYRAALQHAGFVDIEINDRNNWYRRQAKIEREQLAGQHYEKLQTRVGSKFIDHEIEVWDKMIIALNRGELRPTHLRGRKPA